MTVKTIFKVILLTIIVTVMSSLILEMFNLQTTSLQLGSISKMSAQQACVFFSQETYKRVDFKDINTADLIGVDGGVVSGTFYKEDVVPSSWSSKISEMNTIVHDDGSTSDDTAITEEAVGIYANLYLNSNEFRDFLSRYAGNWESLKVYSAALTSAGNDPWGIGEYYVTSLMTPLNMGVPYLDHDSVERIFKWNLASILNNGQYTGSNLTNLKGSGTDAYVLYKGFRVYVNRATISNLDYKLLNIAEADGAAKFKEYTNINPETISEGTNGADDERNKILVVGVEYTVPMSYEGITPIKNVMEFAWDTKVAGMNDNPEAGTTPTSTWDTTITSDLSQGGLEGATLPDGQLPVPGRLVYYLVR